MQKLLVLALVVASTSVAHAEYKTVDLTVFGMDCAPCAHAVHVSVKGIKGVDTVDVDLNTGLVAIKFAAGNTAGMRQIEKNGFTHKDATVTARGKITGTADALFLEVAGTNDRYALRPSAQSADFLDFWGRPSMCKVCSLKRRRARFQTHCGTSRLWR